MWNAKEYFKVIGSEDAASVVAYEELQRPIVIP